MVGATSGPATNGSALVEPKRDTSPASPQSTSEHATWERAVELVRQASARHGKSLSVARFLGFTAEGVRVAFPQDAAFHRAQVIGMSRTLVEHELTKALGRPIKLIEDASPEAFAQAQRSIAEVEATDRASRERAIEQKVREHPGVRAVLKHLGGSIEHIAVLEPVDKPRLTGPSETLGEAEE